MTPITNISNQPTDYSAAVKAAKTLSELRAVTLAWKQLAADAERTAREMNESDWPEYVRGKKAEAEGEFGGEAWYEKYKAILFPDVMFKVAMVAQRYDAPWGLVFQRLVAQERITQNSEGDFEFKGLV